MNSTLGLSFEVVLVVTYVEYGLTFKNLISFSVDSGSLKLGR